MISGNENDNAAGIEITGAGANSNVVQGNLIGTDVSGEYSVSNFIGISIAAGASDNSIGGMFQGDGNVISGYFAYRGVWITDPGTSGNLVQGNKIGTDITGTRTVGNANGIWLGNGATDNTIGGLAATAGAGPGNLISGDGHGVEILDSGTTGNLVVGNLIGTDISGTAVLGNGTGVEIGDASGNTIGGTTAAHRNVISGSTDDGIDIYGVATDNLVAGNLIGIGISGKISLANSNGVQINTGVSGNTIGGTIAWARNIISGNNTYGVYLQNAGGGNVIAGNTIGPDVSGTKSVLIDNGGYGDVTGVLIDDSAGNTVGGTTSGAGNLISGNSDAGIVISGTSAIDNLVAGNLIGTNGADTKALNNFSFGVQIVEGAHNTIGGTTAAAANVISGNLLNGVSISGPGTNDNLVSGNDIGTDLTGMIAIANGRGVQVEEDATGNTIGGATASARNIISGNTGNGVVLGGGIRNVVAGNFIGINSAGSAALANGNNGVYILEAAATGGGVSSSSSSASRAVQQRAISRERRGKKQPRRWHRPWHRQRDLRKRQRRHLYLRRDPRHRRRQLHWHQCRGHPSH